MENIKYNSNNSAIYRNEYSWYKIVLWSFLMSAAVYGITGIPYIYGYFNTPAEAIFNSQLFYINDQNMYFSFIRQAADGHFIFENRLTHIPHKPALINFEWFLVGRIMALFDNSAIVAYEVWRFIGAFAAFLGFSALTHIVLTNKLQRIIALLMFAFGGGFGWFFLALKHLGLKLQWSFFGTFDLRGGYHPFVQIMLDPHFSLPIGLFCLAVAFYMLAEKTGKFRWYSISGIVAAIEASMRPYDFIALYTIIPLFILVTIISKRAFSYRLLFARSLPLIIGLPLFLYYVYIFNFHPVFKFWGSQGVIPFELPLHWFILNIGLAAALFIVRLFLFKKISLGNLHPLPLVWAGAIIFFIHSHKFMSFLPYSFQLHTILLPPIILIGVTVIDPEGLPFRKIPSNIKLLLLVIFIVANSLNIFPLVHSYINQLRSPRIISLQPNSSFSCCHFIQKSELQSFMWLDQNGKESDIVIATEATGNILAKYASIHVVMGHWSVTPNVKNISQDVTRFYKGEMDSEESGRFINMTGAQWVYLGQREMNMNSKGLQSLYNLTKCFDNGTSVIYATPLNSYKCEVL